MALILILGLCTFAGLFAIILFMLPRSTAESALLDQVTRDVRTAEEKNPSLAFGCERGSGGQAFHLVPQLIFQ